ncbi:cadherin-like domain-containing protein [Photobacterium minamisatsumaniensis]|uniref:cadherin-like domain-containing protein n=1 Tax=Photobacterium minamisatsumaniensis TaxID=2910233 RepID=UPI003D0B8C5D
MITTEHDGPLLITEDGSGLLDLNISMMDDSESMTALVMSGYPVGFVVSDGVNTVEITEEGQQINLMNWDVDVLEITPPENWSGNFFVTVTATTVDYGDEISNIPAAESTTVNEGIQGEVNEVLMFSSDDLLELSDIEASEGETFTIEHLNLVDPTQGTISVDESGDIVFAPAEDFTGQVHVTFQAVDQDGNTQDAGVTLGIEPIGMSDNAAPEASEALVEEIKEGDELTFTDAELLANINDADGDDITVSTVQVTQGEGVLTEQSGTYTFTPEAGWVGTAEISYSVNDGTETVLQTMTVTVEEAYPENAVTLTAEALLESWPAEDRESLEVDNVIVDEGQGRIVEEDSETWTFIPEDGWDGDASVSYDVNDGDASVPGLYAFTVEESEQTHEEASAFTADENGTVTFTDADILTQAGIEDQDSIAINDVSYEGDDGMLFDNPDGSYSFWPNDDADSEIALNVSYSVDGEPDQQAVVSFQLEEDLDQNEQDIEEEAIQIESSEADYYGVSGDSLEIAIPENITDQPEVDVVVISGLEDGVSVESALDNGDGSFTVSGDDSFTLSAESEFSGELDITMTGFDNMGDPVEGASDTVTVNFDDDNIGNTSPQSSEQQDDQQDQETDWTQDNNEQGGFDPLMDEGADSGDEIDNGQQGDMSFDDSNF